MLTNTHHISTQNQYETRDDIPDLHSDSLSANSHGFQFEVDPYMHGQTRNEGTHNTLKHTHTETDTWGNQMHVYLSGEQIAITDHLDK